MSVFILKPQQKLLFIGDSITDCGRRGEVHAPYGSGYMSMARNLIVARYADLDLTIENRGVGGDTIRDLKARWQEDVIAEKPDVLSIMIGINDVWRHVTGNMETHVPLDEYEATYRALLTETREKVGPKFVLADPYVIEADRDDHFRAMIDAYCAVVKQLAGEFDAIHVPTQAAFDEALTKQPSEFWANDRVHAFSFGHMVIAQAWLKAVGFEF